MEIEHMKDVADLELVRRFEAGGSSRAVFDELARRVARDGGWLIPGVALYLPTERGMQRQSLSRAGRR